MRLRRALGSALAAFAALVVAGAGGATADRTAACPAPKPLPASLKRPPAGASATQLANFLLALPQRKPCDVSLFVSKYATGGVGLYPEGRPMVPAAGPPPDEAAVRSRLVTYLQGSSLKAATLALFNHPDVRSKLPDPTLRAALVTLRGTVAESVIEYVLTRAPPSMIRFSSHAYTGVIAVVIGSGRTIIFDRKHQGEHFAVLTAIMAHEILHHDAMVTPTEEVILAALTGIVHMQLLARHPELATSGTEASRQLNTLVLLLVNSRSPGSARPALIAPNGKGTAPTSPSSRDDLYAHAKDFHLRGHSASPADNTPAPEVLASIFRRFLATGVAVPKPLTYSKKTAELMAKSNDTWLTPVDRLRVSVLLGLVSLDEVVKYTGLTRAKAIATFRLAPILAAMK